MPYMIMIGLVLLHGIGPMMIHPHMNKKTYDNVNCKVTNVFKGAVQNVSAVFKINEPKKMVIKHFNPQKKGPMMSGGTNWSKCTMSASLFLAEASALRVSMDLRLGGMKRVCGGGVKVE